MNNKNTPIPIILLIILMSFSIDGVDYAHGNAMINSINRETNDYFNSSKTLKVYYAPVFQNVSTLSLYLPFLEGKGRTAFDRSGHNNNGFLEPNQTAKWTDEGGLQFDGIDDYVEITGDPSLRSESTTWTCWFRLDDLALSGRFLLWKNRGGHQYGDFRIRQDQDKVYAIFDDGVDFHYLEYHVPEVSEWHHLSVVLDKENNESILYIDGSPVDSDSYFGGTETNTWDFSIGGREVTNQSIDGAIDEVCVYNGALSASEIADMYLSNIETLRKDPNSKFTMGGWVSYKNSPLPLTNITGVEVYLNSTHEITLDRTGQYKFTFPLPQEVGNYTYEITVENITESGEIYTSVIVDRITISECGTINAWTGEEAIAWYKLKSEFDGQPIESGSVILTSDCRTTWNQEKSRWEYRETRSEEGNLNLMVESVIWDKYGITSLNPDAKFKTVTIRWDQPPWFYPIVNTIICTRTWILNLPPLTWGIIGTLTILAVFIRLGLIELYVEKPQELVDEQSLQIEQLIQPLIGNDTKSVIILKIIHQLLEKGPSPETVEFLREYLPGIIENLIETVEEEK